MLKKAISKDAGESTPEGGTDRTSWGRSPVHWILANGKTPPAFLASENLNRYVEDFDEPRTKLADFFSILPLDIWDLPINRRQPRISKVSIDLREAPAAEKLSD